MSFLPDDPAQRMDRLVRLIRHHDHRYSVLDDPESRPVAEEAVTRLAKALAATHAEASRAALERVKSGKK